VKWPRRFERLEILIAERGRALLATAVLLTGSRVAGEDLLQEGLERLMRNWGRIDDAEGYLRRTLYNLAMDDWRRRRRRPEVLADVEPPSQSDHTDALNLRQALIAALTRLPPRQRAVLVVRYWEGCSVTEAAQLLGCSVGTVTSSAARGLARLREEVSGWEVENTTSRNGAGR